MYDQYGRHLHYLRVSLTDACNLRCVYCMPEDMHFQPRWKLMSDEEILTLVEIAASLGVDKVRLTGGEPTLRQNLTSIVQQIKAIPNIHDLSLTTNGILLGEMAADLKAAGLDRVNISLDTLDAKRFHQITRWGHLVDVMQGIEAAQAAELTPLKINVVVTAGFNDHEVAEMAGLTLERAWDVRFIELMPVGDVADFAIESVITSAETRRRIEEQYGPLQEVPGYNGHDPARPYRISGAKGRLGFISSVSQPFCSGCTRLRLTADGKLRLCLLRDDEVDLLTPLREGADREALRQIMAEAAWRKPWGHGLADHELPQARVMSQIGG